MNMQHHFDIKNASKYGILEAVLINHFEFWISKNKANNKNFHDGTYWTYNSTKALVELFPYVSESQIRRAIDKLVSLDILKKGNYNDNAYDRTLWYAFSENASAKKEISICENEDFHLLNSSNGIDENDNSTITDNKTNNKTNNKTDIKDSRKSFFEEIKNIFSEEFLKSRGFDFSFTNHGRVNKSISILLEAWKVKNQGKDTSEAIEGFRWLFNEALKIQDKYFHENMDINFIANNINKINTIIINKLNGKTTKSNPTTSEQTSDEAVFRAVVRAFEEAERDKLAEQPSFDLPKPANY
jgi:hypothetical protein